MAKLTLTDVGSLQSESSAIQTLAENNARIETALENTLSRDGTTPNQMGAALDMNSNRLMNLPAPVSGSDAARLSDVADALSVDALLVPAFVSGRILSNTGTLLYWAAPSSLPGIGDMLSANNLSDVASPSVARTNLGLGTAAVATVGTSGDALGKLNATLTWSGPQTYSGLAAFQAGFSLDGTANYALIGTTTTLSTNSIGFRGAPIHNQDVDHTFLMNDSGCTVLHTSVSAHTYTIPAMATTALPQGTVIVVVNEGSGVVTISRAAGVTLRIAGSSTNANVSLAANGVASLLKTADNVWRISGTGLS